VPSHASSAAHVGGKVRQAGSEVGGNGVDDSLRPGKRQCSPARVQEGGWAAGSSGRPARPEQAVKSLNTLVPPSLRGCRQACYGQQREYRRRRCVGGLGEMVAWFCFITICHLDSKAEENE